MSASFVALIVNLWKPLLMMSFTGMRQQKRINLTALPTILNIPAMYNVRFVSKSGPDSNF